MPPGDIKGDLRKPTLRWNFCECLLQNGLPWPRQQILILLPLPPATTTEADCFLPPADTATLREIIETLEGSLMHYQQKTHEACISRNGTPEAKGSMVRALSWDLGN